MNNNSSMTNWNTYRLFQFPIVLTTVLMCSVQADELECNWEDGQRVTNDGGWVEFEQGRDESRQLLRLAVWGSVLVGVNCEQLDDDSESEVTIVSRNEGTGPYYRLQIVDFRPEGILTWSYWSEGVPIIDKKLVFLGALEDGYQGAGSARTYMSYRYTDQGLLEQPK